jgi:hypothetical protein
MKQHRSVKQGFALAVYLVALIISVPASAQGLLTSHRVSSVVATELVAGAVAACKEQGYNVTATLVDIDGVRQAMLRGRWRWDPQPRYFQR